MNIVYVLRNYDSGKCYIGSKQWCSIEVIDDVPTIYDQKSMRPYYSSASNKEMVKSLKEGRIFIAEVLEKVGDKKDLYKREEEWLKEMDAMNNPLFYNLTNHTFHNYNYKDTQYAVANQWGEFVKDIASSRGSVSKRYKAAIEAGFNNPYDLYTYIHIEKESGRTCADISRDFNKHRHWANTITSKINLNDMIHTAIGPLVPEMKELYTKGASFELIADMLEVEVPCVIKGLHGFGVKKIKKYMCSMRLGITQEELERKVAKMFYQGSNWSEISSELDINRRTVQKYLRQFLNRRFEVNDFERI